MRAFMELAGEPYHEMGLDSFLFSLSQRHLGLHWPELMADADSAGPMGHRMVRGMHRALAAMASEGNNVVADHVMVESSWLKDCVASMDVAHTYLIGLDCPLDVLEARESDRKDRTLGQARKQHLVVHQDVVYDLVVDSATQSPAECAQAVVDHIEKHEPHALADMREV